MTVGTLEIQLTRFIHPSSRNPKLYEIVVHNLRRLFRGKTDIDFERDMISSKVILLNGDIEQAEDNGGVLFLPKRSYLFS